MLKSDKKWMANKFKESSNEKYKNPIVFPTLKETFKKIQDLCSKFDLPFQGWNFPNTIEHAIQIKKKKTKPFLAKNSKRRKNRSGSAI